MRIHMSLSLSNQTLTVTREAATSPEVGDFVTCGGAQYRVSTRTWDANLENASLELEAVRLEDDPRPRLLELRQEGWDSSSATD